MLSKIILEQPQKYCAFAQRNTARWENKEGDGMHKREALSGKSALGWQ